MNIPNGYKLVPVELTEEMAYAGIEFSRTADKWRAMLDAAPTPPQPIYDEAKERELFELRIHRIAVENGYQFLSFLLPRDEIGKYRTTWVDMAWLGWSESAQSRAKAGEVL